MSWLVRSVAVLLFFTLLVAIPANAPVGISYAASDSMEPTIGVHDGFIRVPAGDVEPGEIVVFENPTRERQYTVHRVVKETPRGFVTKGDNNQVTDQAAGYPHVQREEIRGEVLTVGGAPVVIPNLGILIQFIQEYQAALLALLAGWLLLDSVSAEQRPERPMRAGNALNLVAVVAVVALVLIVLLGGASANLAFIAVTDDANAPQTIPVGEPSEKTIRVDHVSRTPLTHYAVEARGFTVTDRGWNDSTFVLTATIPPQRRIGVHETTVTVHAYPLSLPPDLIERLHAIHPALAAMLTALAAVGPWYLLGQFLVDSNARLRQARGIRRLRRRFRRWT